MSYRSRATLVAALLLLLSAAPARAAGCPGAESCPYLAAATVGERSGGVLRFPQATAVGPDGAVYVADQYTHAIQIFGPDGAFRGEVGATARGGIGLTSVGAVAVAADGSIYVADGTDRIFRFAGDGRLLDSWGGTGSDPGKFRFGTGGGNASGAGGGLAVANGMVYVADTRNDRIQRFAADGSRPVVIVRPGRLARPQGLAVRGSRLIVADDVHHRLAVFDTGGRFIGTIGSGPGAQPRQLRNPYDVAVDGRGRLYVADNPNHRVVRYGPAPGYRYQARWGSFGSGAGQLQYPRGLAVDAAGTSYVADPGNNRVDVFDIGGTPLRTLGTSGRNTGQFIAPLGVGADAGGTRAVADSVVGRVQLLNPDGSVAAAFGSPAPGPTILPDPVAVAFDGGGTAYVLDQRRSRVVVFDRAGKVVRTIGSRGSGPGKLLSPSALAFDANQVLYVADTGNGRIARFATTGAYLGAVGSLGEIRGLAVAPDGSRIYAADGSTNRVYVLDAGGNDVTQISRSGTKAGRLRSPGGLALDAAGNVWVADTGNNRVQQFAPDGTLLTSFGERGTGPGQFVNPAGLSVDCHGLVTVGDTGNNRVQQFQAATAGTCAALPPVQNPPAPLLPTQPLPAPPELRVSPAGKRGILSSRTLPLNVRCDLPCTVSVTGTLATRSRKRGARVTLRLGSRSLAAGRTTLLRPALSARDARRLRRALRGRRGLVATVRVTARASASASTVVTRRYTVTA
jgi:DNA-binding beta-propeller fold protein YncE